MTRRARIVLPGWVHHVTQRGNHQQTVFFGAHDRTVYFRLLAKYLQKWDLSLIGYTLMGNHVHLLVIPEREESLSNGMGQLHHDFSLWQNIQHNTNGHLWQGRFYSSPVEDDAVWEVLRYVELNPVRAHIVENAWDWEWSSANAHVTGKDSSGLLDMKFWEKGFDPSGWKEYLGKKAADERAAIKIRYATMRGYFLGSEATARRLEKELGLALFPKKRGRKPRAVKPLSKLGKT